MVEDDAEICSLQAMAAASDSNHTAQPELMGQFPAHSPRATQSPLMFAPQVYRDSESTPMVCCDFCQRWVHCMSDGIRCISLNLFHITNCTSLSCKNVSQVCIQLKLCKQILQR